MATVYRLETKYGVGPYQALTDGELPKLQFQTLWLHKDHNGRPSPFHDIPEWGCREDRYEYYFGFLLLEDLYEWFYDILEYIEEYFVIKTIKVPEENILLGEKQVAFKYP